MWYTLSKFILRQRVVLFVLLLAITAVMGYLSKDTTMDYGLANVIPKDNHRYVDFQQLQQTFGKDGNMLALAVKYDPLFSDDFLKHWETLTDSLNALPGMIEIISLTRGYNFVKNTEEKRFEIVRFPSDSLLAAGDSETIKKEWLDLPFYKDIIYNVDSNATLLLARFDPSISAKKQVKLVDRVLAVTGQFEKTMGVPVHISGLTYIRSYRIKLITRELFVLLIVGVVLLMVILLFLFRSITAVIFPLIVVAFGVVWALGLMALLHYKITILTGIIPNVIVIIGIPNCVYLLTKYHTEFRKHGNKVRALSRVIQRIGFVTFFANLTTAIGFGVFYFTNSQLLKEFGIVAGIMIFLLFTISIICIPVIFSFLPEPQTKHVKHLDRKVLARSLDGFNHFTLHHPKFIFALFGGILIFSAYGMTKLQTRGYMLDDVPKTSKAYKDLKFMERNFTGAMPLEILIDTKKPNGALKSSTLTKIAKAEEEMYKHPLFAKPSSIADGLMFATQAYYNGNPKRYRLPRSGGLAPEMSFVMTYLSGMKVDSNSAQSQLMSRFVDSTKTIARISTRIPDIGSNNLDSLYRELDSIFKPIFPADEYKVTYTGASVVALEGYKFLVNGLLNSVGMAFLLIAGIMAYLFRTVRMLLISLIPNLIPLLLTAGLMGYMHIPLKPSTVLVFSVAFGISVDYTIHFLAKYRQELTRHRWDITKTVSETIQETGVSMVYTSLILFFGFITFTTSNFDGTKYLGLLVSITLVTSLFSNMVLLPSLLLTFDRVPKRRRHLVEQNNDDNDA